MKTPSVDAIIALAAPGGIERQERHEQLKMSIMSRLPKDLSPWVDEPADMLWAELEQRLGIVKLDEADDLFYNVQLPAGWAICPSDHQMWSYLTDPNGVQRASIFYKGAFYDRSAHWSLDQRYHIETVWDTPNGKWADEPDLGHTFAVSDRKTGKVLFQAEFFKSAGDDFAFYDVQHNAAKEFIQTNFPDHCNPFAYWE